MRFRLAVATALVAVLAGCGAPDEVSRDHAIGLNNARERLDDAVDTAETLRTSPRETRRIRAEVRRIIAGGYFEVKELDEFGLAALGELQQVAPSVVETDADGVPEDLDRRALVAFRRYSNSDPARALVGPVRDEVDTIERAIEDSGADGDTRVPPRDAGSSGGQTVDEYLRAAERDVRPLWPGQADRLRSVRNDL